MRVGVDGFTLRETVAEYYQVANFTLDELKDHGIRVPPGLARLLRDEPSRRRDTAREGSGHDDHDEDSGPDADDESLTRTVALQGGGTLVFDEFGRLKYHVTNDVLNRERQSRRLADLMRFGYFRPRKGGGALTTRAPEISSMHRLRSRDRSQTLDEGW